MTEKKGLPWWAWLLMGCGALALVAAIAVGGLGFFAVSKVKDLAQDFEERPVYTTASAIARFNPDIELVSADEATKTVVLRNTETGEEMTFDLADIEKGDISFEKGGERYDVSAGAGGVEVRDETGGTRFRAGTGGELPDWVPVPDGVEVDVVLSSTSEGRLSGQARLVGFDSADEIFEFYRRELTEQGYSLSQQQVGSTMSNLVGNLDQPRRTLAVSSITGNDGETGISLVYTGAAPE